MCALINKQIYMEDFSSVIPFIVLTSFIGGMFGSLIFKIITYSVADRHIDPVDKLARKGLQELVKELGGEIHFFDYIKEVTIYGVSDRNTKKVVEVIIPMFAALIRHLGLKYVDESVLKPHFIKNPGVKKPN